MKIIPSQVLNALRCCCDLYAGHQIACHLHEMVQFAAGGYFQIYQQFNSNSIAGAVYNSLVVEELPCPEVQAADANIYVQ